MPDRLQLPPRWIHTHLPQTDSTMLRVAALTSSAFDAGEFQLVTADYQTLGRGQRGSSWEAERGANLLFSFAFRPEGIAAARQFSLSEALALAVAQTLEAYTSDIRIKWPNDIYWRERKIGGMLLEHVLEGTRLRLTLTGVGVNLNQRTFRSDAPNPVSLWQITGRDVPPAVAMEQIARLFVEHYELLRRDGFEALHAAYMQRLYRRTGLHRYADAARREFWAEVVGISPLGVLTLRQADGRQRNFAFKEIRFLSDEP